MNEWVLGGLLVSAVVGLLIAVWRAEPRGPGKRFSHRSVLFGGPIGEGTYRGVDAKKNQNQDPNSTSHRSNSEND